MEQQCNEHSVTVTPPMVREVRPPRVSWKSLILCMVVSVVSAMISAYLTIERVSPKPLNHDPSQTAQLAQTLREDWHRQFEQADEERKALEVKVAKLNTQLEKLTKTIKDHETQLAGIQANVPTYEAIKETLDDATKTNDGLQAEAGRLLRDHGVTHVRIRD